MSIKQTRFGMKKGNKVRAADNAAMNDDPIIEDVGVSDIHWISERHVACALVLDTSGSMNDDDAIGQLNAGIKRFKEHMMNDKTCDEHTKACVDVAIVSFSGEGVRVHQQFTAVSDMVPPTLTANGNTPMGAALNTALDMITEQKARYNDCGTPYFRPWIVCITDGKPNDSYAAAAQRLKEMEGDSHVLGYCVGTEGFDRGTMETIFNRKRIFELDNYDFPSLFEFLSNSLSTVRNSDPNGNGGVVVPMPDTLHTTVMGG